MQPDLGVKELAGCQRLVLLDKTDNVERHLIISRSVDELKVVAAPRHIAEAIVNDSRDDVDVFSARQSGRADDLEDRRRVDGERGAGFIARKRFNGIEIKKVHNFEIDVSKL